MFFQNVNAAEVAGQKKNSQLGEKPGNYTLEALKINYHYQENKIKAEGNVKFNSSKLKINADELLINVKQETVIARGEPLIINIPGKEVIKGEELYFNYSNQTGNIYGAETRLDGELRIRGGVIKVVEDKDYRVQIEKASFTPCKLDHPHYQIKATTIKIYPGDKIVGKDIQFWWGKHKLFSLPGYVMEYDEEGNLKNSMPTPHVGYNSEDGITIEMTYPYQINKNSEGKIYIDTTQRGRKEIKFDNTTNLTENTVMKSEYVNEEETEDESEDDEDDIKEQELFKTGINHRLNQKFTLYSELKYEDIVDEDDSREKEKLVTTGLIYHNKAVTVKSGVGYDFVKEARRENLSFGYQFDNHRRIYLYQDYIEEEVDHKHYILSSNSRPVNWRLYYKDGYDLDYSPYLQLGFPNYHNFKLRFGFGEVNDEGIIADRTTVDLAYKNNFKITDKFNLIFSQRIVDNFYNWQLSESYLVSTTDFGFDYHTSVGEKIKIGTGLRWEKTLTRGDYLLPVDETDQEDVIKSTFDFTFPTSEIESAWILKNKNEYNLDEEEWEEIILEVTRQHDCYDLSMNYDFVDNAIGFSIDF